jgi:hypothetical protein
MMNDCACDLNQTRAFAMVSSGPKLVSLHPEENRGPEFEIDVQKRIVFARFGKRVTVQDVWWYTKRLKADRDFDRNFSEIVDLREVEDLELKAADFIKIVDEIDCFDAAAWRAFVVHNSVQDHAARMHGILRPKGITKIFSSTEEARVWVESRPAEPR